MPSASVTRPVKRDYVDNDTFNNHVDMDSTPDTALVKYMNENDMLERLVVGDK